MDILERYYNKQAFTLYSLYAVVPGKDPQPRKIFIPICVVSLLSVSIFEGMKLVVDGFTLPNVVDILPNLSVVLSSFGYVLYVMFATEKDYEELLTIMWNDLKQERNKEENAIKEKYATNAKVFAKYYIVMLVTTVNGMCLGVFAPCLLNLIIPGNQTREKQLIANGEIFIDQKKYFYHIYFFESTATAVVGIIIVASQNMANVLVQHLCGMFEVVGYRLRNITRDEEFETLHKVDYTSLVTRRLHVCIKEYQKSLQSVFLASYEFKKVDDENTNENGTFDRFGLLIAAFYDIPLTIVLVASFQTLTISMVQVTDPELISVKMVLYMIGQFFQFLLISIMGQIEINVSGRLSEHAYNAKWHICPPDVRRKLQLIIMRSGKPCEIVAAKMYTLSIENFMSVIQAVMSFYVVLRPS